MSDARDAARGAGRREPGSGASADAGPAVRGRVILVGAGPGDPGLLTLRGADALREADVVLYDALVAPEILALAPDHAERIDVGKRGHGEHRSTQEVTNEQLVRLAREGRSVVRLKGGDPFVFGRGGEEASACAEAGVPFEVVPGVSTAIAAPACAGIPVTDRRYAASFSVVTGHRDPGEPAMHLRWSELARSGDTLVVLMGRRQIATIAERLVREGRGAETPCAAIEWGSTPAQRVIEAPLGEIAARIEAAGLTGPTTIVIGEVVRLRATLQWLEKRPLFGRRVLVTRSEEQAGDLVRALAAAGAQAVVVPTIRIAPLPPDAPLRAAARELADYDLAIFTSSNAVRQFVRALGEAGGALAELRADVICVGPATEEAAAAAGLRVAGRPERRFDAEGVLERLRRDVALAGRRVLLPRAERAREVLPEGLRAAGARVDVVAVYRTEPAALDAVDLRRQLVEGRLDALTFTSPSTVRHFFATLDAVAREAARRCVVAAIGPVTAAALVEAGRPADVIAEEAGASALVRALVRHGVGRGPDAPAPQGGR